jgi:hypothetical protein
VLPIVPVLCSKSNVFLIQKKFVDKQLLVYNYFREYFSKECNMASKDKAQKEDRKKSKMTIKEKRKAKDEKKKSGSTSTIK